MIPDRLNIAKKNRVRSKGYKNLGPWRIGTFSPTWDKDYNSLDKVDQTKVDMIINHIKSYPYQGRFKLHPLWQFVDKNDEFVVWSAKINNEDRLTYLIAKDKNDILLVNCKGHTMAQFTYSE